jgi:hypothetical protein
MIPSNFNLIEQLLENIHTTTANKVDDVLRDSPAGAPDVEGLRCLFRQEQVMVRQLILLDRKLDEYNR